MERNKLKTFKVVGFNPEEGPRTEILKEPFEPGAKRFNAIEGVMDGFIFDLDIRENGEAKNLDQFNGVKEIIITFVY